MEPGRLNPRRRAPRSLALLAQRERAAEGFAEVEHLEATLPANFVRIHRSAIANIAHARRLVRNGGRWRLESAAGEPLPVSRSRVAELRARLGA